MKYEYYTKEQLKNIRYKFDWADYGYGSEECVVSAYSLLHGQCLQFAGLLSGSLNEKGFNTYVESYRLNDIQLAHVYCVVERNHRKLYMDVRGVNDDYHDFMQEFVDFEKVYHDVNIDIDNKDWINNEPIRCYNTKDDFWQSFSNIYCDRNDAEIINIMGLAKDIIDENINEYMDDIDYWIEQISNSKDIVDIESIIKKGEQIKSDAKNIESGLDY